MKISVIIPSLNEADSIQTVVRAADQGLRSYFNGSDIRIINADGQSTDHTKDAFLQAETTSAKYYLACDASEPHGKGANILRGLKHCQDSDVVLMLDADVRSITTEWIKLLVEPAAKDNIDLVCPQYTRNRYEGNTTNHFSAPLINACLNTPILQPIAGDFALSAKLVKTVIDSFHFQSDYQYGVDSLISWAAAGNKMSVKQVSLGKKIHKPSFPKIVPMFFDVAFSTFAQIAKFRNQIALNSKNNQISHLNISVDDDYISKPNQDAVNSMEDLAIQLVDKQRNLLVKYPEFAFIQKSTTNASIWSKSLSFITARLISTDSSPQLIQEMVEIIQPMYFMRVARYFSEIDNIDTKSVNHLLTKQAAKVGNSCRMAIKRNSQ